MIILMKTVDDEESICPVEWLSNHAVWHERTGKVVDKHLWGDLVVGENGRENVVPAFAFRQAVKTQALPVLTPKGEYSSGETALLVRRIVFRASYVFCSIQLSIDSCVVWQVWIVGSSSYLCPMAASRLHF